MAILTGGSRQLTVVAQTSIPAKTAPVVLDNYPGYPGDHLFYWVVEDATAYGTVIENVIGNGGDPLIGFASTTVFNIGVVPPATGQVQYQHSIGISLASGHFSASVLSDSPNATFTAKLNTAYGRTETPTALGGYALQTGSQVAVFNESLKAGNTWSLSVTSGSSTNGTNGVFSSGDAAILINPQNSYTGTIFAGCCADTFTSYTGPISTTASVTCSLDNSQLGAPFSGSYTIPPPFGTPTDTVTVDFSNGVFVSNQINQGFSFGGGTYYGGQLQLQFPVTFNLTGSTFALDKPYPSSLNYIAQIYPNGNLGSTPQTYNLSGSPSGTPVFDWLCNAFIGIASGGFLPNVLKQIHNQPNYLSWFSVAVNKVSLAAAGDNNRNPQDGNFLEMFSKPYNAMSVAVAATPTWDDLSNLLLWYPGGGSTSPAGYPNTTQPLPNTIEFDTSQDSAGNPPTQEWVRGLYASAVTVSAKAKGKTATAATLTYSLTSADPFVVVSVHWDNNAANVLSVTFNGAALTSARAATSSPSGLVKVQQFYLATAAIGTHDVVITLDHASNIGSTAISANGARGTITSVEGTDGSVSPAALNFPITAGALALDAISVYNHVPTSNQANQETDVEGVINFAASVGGGALGTPPGLMRYGFMSSDYAYTGLAIQALATPNIGYRYLTFEVKSLTTANRDFTVQLTDIVAVNSPTPIPDKVWNCQTGGVGDWTVITIDLCAPNSGGPGNPDKIVQDTQYPAYYSFNEFGVALLSQMRLNFSGAGEQYQIQLLQLLRNKDPRWNFLVEPIAVIDGDLPVGPPPYPPASYLPWRGATIDVDGRRVELANAFFNSGALQIAGLGLADTVAAINGIVGWSATALQTAQAWNIGLFANEIGGNGGINIPAGGQSWFDTPLSSGVIQGQMRSAVLICPPACGDIFGVGGSTGDVIVPVRLRLRGCFTGLTLDQSTGQPIDNDPVTVMQGSTPTGATTSDGQARYLTPMTYPVEGVPCVINITEDDPITLGVVDRYIRRCCPAFSPKLGWTWHLQDKHGRLHTATVVKGDVSYSRSNTAELPFSVTNKVTNWGDVLFAAMVVQVPTDFIYMLVTRKDASSGALSLYEHYSWNDGSDFSAGTLIMANGAFGIPWGGMEDGSMGYSWFVYNSGTSGNGSGISTFSPAVGVAFNTPYHMIDKATGLPLSIADGGWSNVSRSRANNGMLTWTPTLAGATTPSLYFSTDDGQTWSTTL